MEVMYSAFPLLLYLNASLGGALLAPLLEAQESSEYQPYAASDLGEYPLTFNPSPVGSRSHVGSSYPRAQGHSSSHPSGVERKYLMRIRE